MTIFNDSFLSIIQKHIEQLRADGKREFSTVDVIRQYIKHYYADGTNPHDSINANIGKFIGENTSNLGIREKAPKQPINDDAGIPTQTSIWEFISSTN